MTGFWVFGYGSLMWDPGFEFAERRLARLDGFHRAFCLRSVHYRGTAAAPGLVLGLDAAEGAACTGVVYRVPAASAWDTLVYLRRRELVSYAYHETRATVQLAGGGRVGALAYVVDPLHAQYCGRLTLEDQAQIIARAEGLRGPNRDYLWNTVEHLAELGICDDDLAWLAARVRALAQLTNGSVTTS